MTVRTQYYVVRHLVFVRYNAAVYYVYLEFLFDSLCVVHIDVTVLSDVTNCQIEKKRLAKTNRFEQATVPIKMQPNENC